MQFLTFVLSRGGGDREFRQPGDQVMVGVLGLLASGDCFIPGLFYPFDS